MFLKKELQLILTLAVFLSAILTSQSSQAQAQLYGSGYYGGQQQCNYPTRVGTNATSMSDEEKEARAKVTELKKDLKIRQLEKKRAETELEFLTKKIERYFDGDIVEFLLKTHMEKMNKCDDYKTFPGLDCIKPAGQGTTTAATADANGKPTSEVSTVCGSKDDVPDKLKDKWTKAEGGGYCTATSTSSRGMVSGAICSDNSLRPTDASKYRSYSTTECSKSLSDYRKRKIELDNAQAKLERAEEEMREREFAISDARERAKLDREYKLKTQVEGECEECLAEGRGYKYEKPKTDWWNVAAQVGLGLGLGFVGKKYDEANMEYQAQLGYPPTQGYPTAVSLGLPFILGGVYGAVNGGAGQGSFGCAGGINGAGNPYGAGMYGGMNGGANGAYGPFGPQGGAFGYPQGMYGAPWGGGMYNPGMGPYGGFNGPNGGFPGGMNGQFGVGIPMNGQFGNQMGGYPGAGGFAGGGYPGLAASGGFAAAGGFAAGGGYPAMGGFAAGGGYPGAGYQMGGYPGAGGFAGGGYPGLAASGGFAVAGGFAAGGGYPGAGYQMGGYPGAGGFAGGGYPGLAASGGFAAAGGFAAGGGYPGLAGGYPGAGGFAAGGAGGFPAAGGFAAGGFQMGGGPISSPQYQIQMLQQQQQMLQQQQQYYQAQQQAQMQEYQRRVQIQQQASQVQQEIASLQMRLQLLYSGAYSGSGAVNGGPQIGGGIYGGVTFGSAAPAPGYGGGQLIPVNGGTLPPQQGPGATVPGPGTGIRTGR